MRVKVTHTVDNLAADLAKIPPAAAKDMRAKVNEGARTGNTVAKDFARESSGTHGRHYPKAFTWEPSNSFHGFGGSVYAAEYGPDAARPQGGMATGFEWAVGRQTTPHMNLWRSADLIGPSFAQEVRGLPDRWFWR